MVLSATGSEQGSTGCQHNELSENIWLHGLDHQIIEYTKKEKVITDKRTHRHTDTQTHRHTEFPLVDTTPSVEGVE